MIHEKSTVFIYLFIDTIRLIDKNEYLLNNNNNLSILGLDVQTQHSRGQTHPSRRLAVDRNRLIATLPY